MQGVAKATVSIQDAARQLHELGVEPGGVLVVHTSFSRVRPIENGPAGLIEALRSALGPDGTLVMPSFTDDDETPFDPAQTPCHGVGVVADTFWRLPEVLRSDSPHAFAAVGPHARLITSAHPVEAPHCAASPIGRVHGLDGQILLLGAGHNANTTIHLAEALAGVRYRREKHATVTRDGHPHRIDYGEIDHCCVRFDLMETWLEAAGRQRHGEVAHAPARLVRARHVVAVALEELRADETVFLHPVGVDVECDEARASLERFA